MLKGRRCDGKCHLLTQTGVRVCGFLSGRPGNNAPSQTDKEKTLIPGPRRCYRHINCSSLLFFATIFTVFHRQSHFTDSSKANSILSPRLVVNPRTPRRKRDESLNLIVFRFSLTGVVRCLGVCRFCFVSGSNSESGFGRLKGGNSIF